jgi:hypothetical protein
VFLGKGYNLEIDETTLTRIAQDKAVGYQVESLICRVHQRERHKVVRKGAFCDSKVKQKRHGDGGFNRMDMVLVKTGYCVLLKIEPSPVVDEDCSKVFVATNILQIIAIQNYLTIITGQIASLEPYNCLSVVAGRWLLVASCWVLGAGCWVHILPPPSLCQVNPLPALPPPAHQDLTTGPNRTTMIHPLEEECIQTPLSLTSAAAIASTCTLGDTVGNMGLSCGSSTTGDTVRIQMPTPPD